MALRVAARPVVRRANIALLSLPPHYLTTKSHVFASKFLPNSTPPLLNQNGNTLILLTLREKSLLLFI